MRACAALAAALLLAAAPAAAQDAGVRAIYASEGVAIRPDDALWKRAPESKIALLGQLMVPPQGGGSVAELSLRAMHDGRRLALRFEWADPTADREVGVATFRDAVAVGFPARESELLPSPFMGDPERPLDIWQWTADFDANARGQGGFADRYPHTEGVWYSPLDYSVTREVRAWRGSEPVIELTATGWGTLARKSSQNVLGQSDHARGRWRVVLRRELATGNPEDVLFRPGERTHAIFAVWNGSREEVNGKKNVTMQWVPLALDATAPEGH